MKTKLLSRAIVALALGMLLAFGLHHEMQKRARGGREAFIAEQSQRWDRVYAHPPWLATGIIVSICGTLLAAGVYELLVAGVSCLLRKSSSNDDRS